MTAKAPVDQQMRQFMGDNFIDKRQLVLDQQYGIEPDLPVLQVSTSRTGAALLIADFWLGVIRTEMRVGQLEFFPQTAHNGLLQGDGESGVFHQAKDKSGRREMQMVRNIAPFPLSGRERWTLLTDVAQRFAFHQVTFDVFQ